MLTLSVLCEVEIKIIKLRIVQELYSYTSSYYYVLKITILNNIHDPASTASLI